MRLMKESVAHVPKGVDGSGIIVLTLIFQRI